MMSGSCPLPLSKAVESIDWENDILWTNGVSYAPHSGPVVGAGAPVPKSTTPAGSAAKRPSPNSAPGTTQYKRPSGKVSTSKARRRHEHEYDAVSGADVLFYPLRSTTRASAASGPGELNAALLADNWTPLLPPALPGSTASAAHLTPLTADLPLRASALGQMVAATWTAHGFRAALRGGVPWLRPGVLAPAVGAGADAGAAIGTGITGELLISHSKPAMQLHPALYPLLTNGRHAHRVPPLQPLSRPSQHDVTGTQSVVLTDGRRSVDVLYGVSDDAAASASAAAASAGAADGQAPMPSPSPVASPTPAVDLSTGVAPPLQPIAAAKGPTADALEALLPAARGTAAARLAVRRLGEAGDAAAKPGAAGRAGPGVLPVSGPVSFDSVEGLSARWGELVLLEYTEEAPLVLSGPGMSSRITTYWLPTAPMHRALRRRAATGKRPLATARDWDENDADLLADEADGQPAPGEDFPGAEEDEDDEEERPGVTCPPHVSEGTLHVLESAKRLQMLGTIGEGQWITAVENKLFAAPAFEHNSCKAGVEFLLVMSKTDPPPNAEEGGGTSDRNAQWVTTLRKLPPLFVVGQVEPRTPFLSGKGELGAFLEGWAQLAFARLAAESRVADMVGRRQMQAALGAELGHPRMLELLLSDVARYEVVNDAWRAKGQLPAPETLLAQSAVLTPEAACIWHAIRQGTWALRRRGVRVLRDVDDAKAAWRTLRLLDQALRDAGARAPVMQGLLDATAVLQQALQVTPWSLAEDYVKVFLQGGVGSLTLDGPAGSRAGDPSGCGEGFSFVRDPMYKQRQAGARNTGTKEGTQLDKRKLTINQLVEQLMHMGVQQSAVRGLSRWALVQKYKQVVNSRQIAGDMIQGALLDADALEHVSTDLRSAAEKKAAKEAQAAAIQEAQLAALAARDPPQLEDEGGDMDGFDDDGDLERELAVQHANQAGDAEGLSEFAERTQWLQSMNADSTAAAPSAAPGAANGAPQLNAAEAALPAELRSPPAPVHTRGVLAPPVDGAAPAVSCMPLGPPVNDPHEADVVSMVQTLVWHHVRGLHFRNLRTRIMTVSVDDAGKEVVRVTFGRNKWDVRAAWLKQATGVDLYAVNRRTNLGRKSKFDRAVAEREQAKLAACLRALAELRVPDNSDPSRMLSFAGEYKFAVRGTVLRMGPSRSVPVCSSCKLFGHNSGKCPVHKAQAMGTGSAGSVDVPALAAQFRAAREQEGLAAAAAGEDELDGDGDGDGDEGPAEEDAVEEAVPEAVAPHTLFLVFGPQCTRPPPLLASRTVKAQLALELERLVLAAASMDPAGLLRGVPSCVMGEAAYHAALAEHELGADHVDLASLRAAVLRGEMTDVDSVYAGLAQIQDNMFVAKNADSSLAAHFRAAERMSEGVQGWYHALVQAVDPLRQALERAEEDGRNADLLLLEDPLAQEALGGGAAAAAPAAAVDSGAAAAAAGGEELGQELDLAGLEGELERGLADGLGAAASVPPVADDAGDAALDSLDEALAGLAGSDSDSEDEVLEQGTV